MTHTNTHPQDYNRNYPIVSQPTRLCKGCGGSVCPNLHTDVLECLSCKGTDWEWIQEAEAEDYRKGLEAKQIEICNNMVAEIAPTLDAIRGALQIAEVEQESMPYLERRRETVYLGKKMTTFEDAVLAHLDELVGPERLPISDMLDAIDLFPRNYNNKHVPGSVCPKCGAQLIVKERRMRRRSGDPDYVTNFVACVMFERTGCGHTEPITDEIKYAIDSQVMADIDLGI